MGQKKGGARVSEDPEDLTHVPLQAILIADSFAQTFRPITLERPKVLLPLVNTPMIDYTLAWLESAGVAEVFVFCCAHSKQVLDHLESSEWLSHPNFSVRTIESHNSISAGDALRVIYEQHVIHGDFVLISGDTVSNMSLTEALHGHKERRKNDTDAVMTMIIKRSKASLITHQSRLGTDEIFMAIDPQTKQLLYYEDKADMKGILSIDNTILADNASITLHDDKQDCYIDICSPEVLSLFTDNFDYQHLRRHFVKGLLVDDIMGYKIFTHEIHSSYAARIDNFRSYDTVSKDIIQRWTYPFVPDVPFFGISPIKLERQAKYRSSEIEQSRSSQIGPFTFIGRGTCIGSDTVISNSVIGECCKIGSNVSIEGSYIWKNVTIEDGCVLKHAIVCDGVIMRSGAVLGPGAILSFKVVIGQQFAVPVYSKVSLLQQPTQQDSDEELEYADNSSGNINYASESNPSDMLEELVIDSSDTRCSAISEVGPGGVGYIWPVCESGQEEEWRHSVAPISADKVSEIIQARAEILETLIQDDTVLPPSGELKLDSISNYSEEYNSFDHKDDSVDFEKEVEATFLRAVHESVTEDNVILEVNSLRLSYNMESEDCASAIFYSVIKLALESPHASTTELEKNLTDVIIKWKKLLSHYLPGLDEEIEAIQKFEEMCESAKELSPLFVKVLKLLYDNDILEEDAILRWAHEKEGADESDRVFVKQCEDFIRWLNEASEEESEDEED